MILTARKQQRNSWSMSHLVKKIILLVTLFNTGACESFFQFDVNGYNITFDPDTFSQFISCLNITSFECEVTFVKETMDILKVLNTTALSDANQQINDSIYFNCTAPSKQQTQKTVCTRNMVATPDDSDLSTCNLLKYQINKDTAYTFGIIFYYFSQRFQYNVHHNLSVKIERCFENVASQVELTDGDWTFPISITSLITEADALFPYSSLTSTPNNEFYTSSSVSATLAAEIFDDLTKITDEIGKTNIPFSEISPTQTSKVGSPLITETDTLIFNKLASMIDESSNAMTAEVETESSYSQSSQVLNFDSRDTNEEIQISNVDIIPTFTIDMIYVGTQGTLVSTPKQTDIPNFLETRIFTNDLESSVVPAPPALTTLYVIERTTVVGGSASYVELTPLLHTAPFTVDPTLSSPTFNLSPSPYVSTSSDSYQTPSPTLILVLITTPTTILISTDPQINSVTSSELPITPSATIPDSDEAQSSCLTSDSIERDYIDSIMFSIVEQMSTFITKLLTVNSLNLPELSETSSGGFTRIQFVTSTLAFASTVTDTSETQSTTVHYGTPAFTSASTIIDSSETQFTTVRYGTPAFTSASTIIDSSETQFTTVHYGTPAFTSASTIIDSSETQFTTVHYGTLALISESTIIDSSETQFTTVHYGTPALISKSTIIDSSETQFTTVHYDTPALISKSTIIDSSETQFTTVHYDTPTLTSALTITDSSETSSSRFTPVQITPSTLIHASTIADSNETQFVTVHFAPPTLTSASTIAHSSRESSSSRFTSVEFIPPTLTSGSTLTYSSSESSSSRFTSFEFISPTLISASTTKDFSETPSDSFISVFFITPSTNIIANSLGTAIDSVTTNRLAITFASTITIDDSLFNFSSPKFSWSTTETGSKSSTYNWLTTVLTSAMKHASASEIVTTLTGHGEINGTVRTIATHAPEENISLPTSTQYYLNATLNSDIVINTTAAYTSSETRSDGEPIIIGTVVGFALLVALVVICYLLVKKRKRDQIKKRSKRYKGVKDNYEMIKVNHLHGFDPPSVPSKAADTCDGSQPRKWSQPAESSLKVNPAPRKFSDPGPQSNSEHNKEIALKKPLKPPVKLLTPATSNYEKSDVSVNSIISDEQLSESLLNEPQHWEGSLAISTIHSGVQLSLSENAHDIETDNVYSHSNVLESSTNNTHLLSTGNVVLKPHKERSASKPNSLNLNVDVLISGLENSILNKNNPIKKPARKIVQKQTSQDGSGYTTISVTDVDNVTSLRDSSSEYFPRHSRKLTAEDAESVYSTVICEDIYDKKLPNYNFGSQGAEDDGYTTVDSDSTAGDSRDLRTTSSHVNAGSLSFVKLDAGERSSMAGLYSTVDLIDLANEEEVTPRLNRHKDKLNIIHAKPKQNNYSLIWPRNVQSDPLGSPSHKIKHNLPPGNTKSAIPSGAAHEVYSTLHTETRSHQNPYSTIIDLKRDTPVKNGIASMGQCNVMGVTSDATEGSAVVNPVKSNYTLINIGPENLKGNITSVKVTTVPKEANTPAKQANGELLVTDKVLSDDSFHEKENVYFELEKET